MKAPHQPSILLGSLACVALLIILATELATIPSVKAREKACVAKEAQINAELNALGPLAAPKADLEACLSRFEESNPRPTAASNPVDAARKSVDLSNILATGGMDAKDAQTCAAALDAEVHLETAVAEARP